MFTVPTGDVLAFLSTDFMPIVESTELSRTQVEALAVDGAVHVAVVKDGGSGLPASDTLYTSVKGDGSGAVVELTTDASGTVTAASMWSVGSGYSYGNLLLETGEVYTDSGLTAAAGAFSGTAAIELVISPKGGHGSDAENEMFAKRIMTNIRLTYDEGAGDFPVDNDFRRIGIIQDPYDFGTTDFADSATLRGTYSMVVTGASSDYTVDEDIFQVVTGGTAYGKVVSWDASTGVLKYYQSPELHSDSGVVRAFESNAANAIIGASSTTSGNVDTSESGTVSDIAFTGGLASPEIEPNSGEIVYIENRRQITRAADQIEDIKLVIEF